MSTRYYASVYGNVWSMTGPQYIAFLQCGADDKNPDLNKFGRRLRSAHAHPLHRGGEPTAWQLQHDVIFPLDWNPSDFQWELTDT